MLSISLSNTLTSKHNFSTLIFFTSLSSSTSVHHNQTFKSPLNFSKNPSFFSHFFPTKPSIIVPKSSDKDSEETEVSTTQDEWLCRLPDKKKPLYAHSLPSIEAWLRSLGFYQSNEDRALWFIENSEWHAQLSLESTDLYIRYLKSGPGNLEKDVERRFSYALSREDIENAVLGGP